MTDIHSSKHADARGRRLSFALLVLALAGAAPATVGCRAVLGIEDLPDDNSFFPDASTDGSTPGEGGGAPSVRPPEGGSTQTPPAQSVPDAAPDRNLDSAADVPSAVMHPDAAPDAGVPEAGGPAPVAKLAASQPSLSFGTATQHQAVSSGEVQITNLGTATTAPLRTAVAGAAFSVATDGCGGKSLGPSLSCIVSIALDTTTAGQLTGSVTVTDSTSDSASESLTATVVTPGSVTVSPTAEPFPGTVIGAVSPPVMFTIANGGMTATGALAVTFGGANASEFSVVDGCTGRTLGINATCNVSVAFAPVTSGPKTASLAVTATPGGVGTASLTGTGLAPAAISITPTSYLFPQVALFDAGAPPSMTFLVTNGGDLASTALTTGIAPGSGTTATDFLIGADSCKGKALAGMSTCNVAVQFQPAAFGNKAATLQVNGNAATASLGGSAADLLALTITKTGAGGGTVVDTSGAINCGTACSAGFERTTVNPVVALTATPNASSVFAGWTGGGCTGTSTSCIVTLSAATTVSAIFNAVPEAVTVNFHGIGTQTARIASSPGGLACSGPSCTATANFNLGTTVTLTVTQAAGAIIAWSNGCVGTTCAVSPNQTTIIDVTTTNQNVMFVTDQQFNGNLGGLAGANGICNTAAAAAGVPGNFVALLGTSTTSMYAPLGAARGWIRIDGLPFTDTAAGLQNQNVMFYPPALSELGTPTLFGTHFTGSDPTATCSDWTSTTGNASAGDADEGVYFSGLHGVVGGATCASGRLACFGTNFATPVTVTPVAGRHVFVTSGIVVGSVGLSAADAMCQSVASGAALANPGHFLAALATTTASVSSRFNLAGTPWVRVDGVQVALTPTAFMQGALIAPPSTDEDGNMAPFEAWMGSSQGMTAPAAASGAENCNDWSSISATLTGVFLGPPIGGPTETNAFTVFTTDPIPCSSGAEILCLEN
jgi:hypothetical protein